MATACVRDGSVASTTPRSATPKASNCTGPSVSPSTSTPVSAVKMGSITLYTPACAAGTTRRPVIHSHTVPMLAAMA